MGDPKHPSPQPRISGDILVRESLGRILVLKIVLLLCMVLVAGRLVQLQLVDAHRYQTIAKRQYESKVALPAARGNMYDRNGKILVSNTRLVSFAADPKMVGEADKVARTFSRVFGKPKTLYASRLSDSQKRFVWLERRTAPEYAGLISAGTMEGVIHLEESKRLYHYDHVAGQVIGFTDIDNKGLSGSELEFDEVLRGVEGHVIMQRDGLGRKKPSVDYPRVDPVNGRHIALTIDLSYQSIAEEELRKGIERTKAQSGLVVMVEPFTGEILAMANYPSINGNKIAETSPAHSKNRIITDTFEPGSVFKIVTMAAALEKKAVNPTQKFFAENGTYVVQLSRGEKRTISDTHPHAMLTVQEAMEVSSNIVMAKISDLTGAEAMFTTARDFGFGTNTGIELGGEVGGELKKPNTWSGTTLNSIAYGYEVSVTPLQLAMAYAAIASGGVLMKPYLLKRQLDQDGDVVAETTPQIVRKVMSRQTARIISEMLTGAVERGTGISAKLPAMKVAGKTGTSRKYIDGKYELGSYTASFAGYFPAEDPKVVCVVMLDNPRAGGYTGGLASAPIFKSIVEKIVATSERFSSEPLRAAGDTRSIPDVKGLIPEVARKILVSNGFAVQVQHHGKLVLAMHPAAGTRVPRGSEVRLVTAERGAAPEGFTIVPNVKGLTLRRAISQLSIQRLAITVEGSGIVEWQSIAPGKQVREGTIVALRVTPRQVAMAGL